MTLKNEKIVFVLGTRPEIIKLSPVIHQCLKKNLPFEVIFSGQHYDYELAGQFFDELELERPKYYLNVGSGTQATQTGNALIQIEEVLIKIP